LGVRFPAVRSLSLLSLADPQWRGQRCDANAGSAASLCENPIAEMKDDR
jgi:hypothetical protein